MTDQAVQSICRSNTEYYARVRAFGLRRTNADTVFVDPDRNLFSVPRPDNMNPAQMEETLEMIRERIKACE